MATLAAEIATAAEVEAMRADSLSAAGRPDGRREVASAKELDLPGKCMMSNFYRPVRCLSRNKRGFDTDSNGFEPSRDTRGLWSVATIRRSQPCVK